MGFTVTRTLPGLAVLAVAATGCTTTITGQAHAPDDAGPRQPEIAQLDLCSFISEAWLHHLELRTEDPSEDNLDGLNTCRWFPDGGTTNELSLSVSAIWDTPKHEWLVDCHVLDEEEHGGLAWERFGDCSIFDENCGYLLEVGENEMIEISSELNDSDDCEIAEKAAPLVAAHLPGGSPAPDDPEIETSPLEGVDPCDLLTDDQAEDAGYRLPSREHGDDEGPWCWWDNEDEDHFDGIAIHVHPSKQVDQHFRDEPDDELDVGDNTWLVFDAWTGDFGHCQVALPTSERSFVAISSTNTDDTDKACDQAKDLAPVVTENLPN
jgi:hypothetical protein